MKDKNSTNRAARRYALAELRRRHANEFATILAEKRSELRGETTATKKTTARKPRRVKN